MHFPEIVRKGGRKALRFSLIIIAFCVAVNHHFSHEENAIRISAKTRTPIPYKHCRLRRLWNPISANGWICFQNHWFFQCLAMWICPVRNHDFSWGKLNFENEVDVVILQKSWATPRSWCSKYSKSCRTGRDAHRPNKTPPLWKLNLGAEMDHFGKMPFKTPPPLIY